jgi:hypothetical protein
LAFTRVPRAKTKSCPCVTSFNAVLHDSVEKMFLIVPVFFLMPEHVQIIGAAKGKNGSGDRSSTLRSTGKASSWPAVPTAPQIKLPLAIRRIKDPLTFNCTHSNGSARKKNQLIWIHKFILKEKTL